MDPALLSVVGDVTPKAPGMKYRHYAPKAQMKVFCGGQAAVVSTINETARRMVHEEGVLPEEIGILATEETVAQYDVGQVVTVGSRQRDDVGRYLYGALRRFDELHVKVILSESFYDSAREEAVMNRLLKAAGQQVVEVDDGDGVGDGL